jgi:hypothetical protein
MNGEKNNIQHAFDTVLHPNFFLPLPRFSICVSHRTEKFSIKGMMSCQRFNLVLQVTYICDMR